MTPDRRPPARVDAAFDRPRFDKQLRLTQVGAAGQARLAAARVVVVGCGATGSHLASALARAGVGRRPAGWLRLVDRDVVESANLPRQVLYTDADARELRPKAAAAAEALAAVDPALALDPRVEDLGPDNVSRLLGGAQLVLDGTDNFPTRFLLNDWCVRHAVPWIYCGVVGVEGQAAAFLPGGPCLRCYVPEPPPPGVLPTCDTAGVLGSVVGALASLAATAAIRLLVGSDPAPGPSPPVETTVLVLDGWEPELRALRLPRDPACPCCGRGEHPFLDAAPAAAATELCGREAVALPATGGEVDLAAVAERLASVGAVKASPFLVRVDLPDPRPEPGAPGAGGEAVTRRLLVFRDGRVIVGGTRDPTEARSLRSRLLGD